MNWKKYLSVFLAAAMVMPSVGGALAIHAEAEGIETDIAVKTDTGADGQYNFAADFTGNVQGPVWFQEYEYVNGANQGERKTYEEWVEEWNCWIGLEGVLTSGMENEMGLVAPAPTADTLLTWKAPRDGVAELSFAHPAYLRRQHQTSGNVGVYLEKNKKQIYPQSGEMLLQAQSRMYLNPMLVEVKEGDQISFGMSSKKNLTDTSAYLTPVVTYVEREVKSTKNAALEADITASSTAPGYSVQGLTDYNTSEQHKNYEWKAESAESQWIKFALGSEAEVTDLVLVDGSESALAGDIRCTFSDGASVSFTADQMAGRDGVHTASLPAPVLTSSVKIEFINNGSQIPALGDAQIVTAKQDKFTVKLNDSGNITEVVLNEENASLGDRLPTPQKEGFVFKEWNTSEDGTGKTVTGSTVFTGNAVIYAIYREIFDSAVYYVDSENGSDSNEGTSEDAAWASLEKVNSRYFVPGDKILFKAGTIYKGALILEGSGTKEAPIIVDRYGEGAKPHIEGAGEVRHTVHLKNVNYVTVKNLEITNNAAERKLLTGVFVEASGCGVMEGVHLDSLDVHDVYGTRQEKTLPNGGIYYEVTDESNDTRFNDISVQNCTAKRVSRTGISVGMTESSDLWDGHGGIIPEEVKEKYGHTNVLIKNNYVEESGGDAIVPMFSIAPVIEYNISNGASQNTKDTWDMYNAAIWPWRCEDAVFQFNEAYNTVENGDGQAYDCDYSRHTVYQYNYSHDNGGGFMLVCQTESLDSVIRYNVSQNDRDSLFLMSNPDNAEIYNNTFYVGPGLSKVVDSGGKATLKNNIFYCPEGVKLPNNSWGSGFTYDNNLFYGFETTPNDRNKIVADPLFTDPGKGGTGTRPGEPALDTLGGYQLRDESPAINTGVRLSDNGGRDFAGNPVGDTKPDLGAFESDVVPLMTLAQEEIAVTDAGASVKVEAAVREGSELEGSIRYTSSNEEVAAADAEGQITFYGYGTADILVSAVIDGKETALSCKVTLKEEELENYKEQFDSAYANTADVENPAGAMIDGDEATFWHTNWHGDGFVVSEENPAILTAKLKKGAAAYNGFRFQQRPSNVNGLTEKFKYVVGNTFDEAANQITDGTTSEVITESNPANGTWVNVDLPEGVNGTYIQLRILGGTNEFASVAEIETYQRINYRTAENDLVIARNKLKKAEQELADALKLVEDLKEEVKDSEENAQALQDALTKANEALAEAQAAQKELQEALEKAEADKNQADADKEQAESDRDQAEADKEQAESEKAQAEADKEQAEADRDQAQAEKDRQAAEAEKKKAEAEAARAEAGRLQAEKDRALEESERLKKELEAAKKELQNQQEKLLKKGDTAVCKNVTYRVLDPSKQTAAVVGGKNVSSVTIAKTVKIKGISCRVTEVAANAFRSAEKLTKVTIGTNVQKIGKQAFCRAARLKTVTIRSAKLKSVGRQAFTGVAAKVKISVPKSKKTAYKRLLKGKIPKKAMIK